MLDYEILRIIWWVLLGVLLTGFAVMDGFDMGVAICLPWLAKTDEERQALREQQQRMQAERAGHGPMHRGMGHMPMAPMMQDHKHF